jgi:MGT family glycosyltransferase
MRLLFVLVEAGGNVPPQLGLVRRLVERGHHVRVLADRVLEPGVVQVGAEYAPFRHAPHLNTSSRTEDPVRDWEATNPIEGVKRFGEHVLFGPATKYARDVLDEVERFRPAALAVDCLLLGALVGAEKSGLPTASIMHMVCQLPLRGVPPFGLGLRRARGPLGHLRDRILWSVLLRTMDGIGLARVNEARSALGLGPVAHAFDMMQQADVVLVLTSRAFDRGPEPCPPHVRYVGAQIDDPGWVEAWTSPFPDERDPLVVVALGSTFQNQGALVQRTIDALGSLPVRGLVTLGRVFEPSEFQARPNVHVARSAPHAAVLPSASVVIAHGGHGTVIKALASGVPVLCIPLGRDQKENATRAVEAGAGLTLSPAASADAIAGVVTRLLGEPGFRAAARELAARIREERRTDRAVEELEALAQGAGAPAKSSARAAPCGVSVGRG